MQMPTLLLISDNEDIRTLWQRNLEDKGGFTCLVASLTPGGSCPPAANILRQRGEGSPPIDGVLLFDPSKTGPDPHYKSWKEADHKLKQLPTLRLDVPQVEVESGNPVKDANRQAVQQESMNKEMSAYYDEVEATLRSVKEAAERRMLTNPPSDEGCEFLKRARASGSPCQNAVIVVAGAFAPKRDQLIRAGATIVQTTQDRDVLGLDTLLEAMRTGVADMAASSQRTPKPPGITRG
jgi:CheY-like chemotaxis protein